MKYTVYVLKDVEGKYYKGFTSDLSRRLAEHRAGKTRTTAQMGKCEVIYTEEHNTLAEVRKRELYLKSAAGRRFLKKRFQVKI